MLKGEQAPARGWLARAGRLLDDGRACVEQAYTMLPAAVLAMFSGDAPAANVGYTTAAEIGERFDDPTSSLSRASARGRP